MYANISGILLELISKDEFEKILDLKQITSLDICKLLKIRKNKYFKLINGVVDFTELELLKLEKFLDERLVKNSYKY